MSEHSRTVCSLYRSLLKTSFSWNTGSRHLWFRDVVQIRAAFKANMGESNPRAIARMIEDARAAVARFAHPDPYRFPEDEGGATFQRNLPVPEWLVEDNTGYGEWEVPPVEPCK